MSGSLGVMLDNFNDYLKDQSEVQNQPTEKDSWKTTQSSNPYVNPWPMMENPLTLLTILITYLYFVLRLGPQYMRQRKPFQLKTTLMLYNIFQVLFSVFLVYEGINVGPYQQYLEGSCKSVGNRKLEAHDYRIRAAVWWYLFAKVTELLDTVFFVLRKKQVQVTFVHVYHHVIMPVQAWVHIKLSFSDEHFTVPGTLNSFIHIIMYSYYLLAALGPQFQKYLWWKKYLTTLQLIQFALMIVQIPYIHYIGCSYSKPLAVLHLFNVSVFMYFFLDFYRKSYRKAKAA